MSDSLVGELRALRSDFEISHEHDQQIVGHLETIKQQQQVIIHLLTANSGDDDQLEKWLQELVQGMRQMLSNQSTILAHITRTQ